MAQVEGVGDPWIGAQQHAAAGDGQLMVVSDRLAFGDEEDGVLVGAFGLQALNLTVVSRHRVQAHLALPVARAYEVIEVELVDLLTQHHAFAGAQCLLPLLGTQLSRQFRFGQGLFPEGAGARWQPPGITLREVLGQEVTDDPLPVDGRADVVPGHSFDGWLEQAAVVGNPGAGDVGV